MNSKGLEEEGRIKRKRRSNQKIQKKIIRREEEKLEREGQKEARRRSKIMKSGSGTRVYLQLCTEYKQSLQTR